MKCKSLSCPIVSLLAIVLFLFFGIIVPKVLAEYRRHEAHVHGVAQMNVALEGNNIYIELTGPAANFVGFEHHPRTPGQKAAVKKTIETLEAGEKLFALPSGAGGRLVKSMVHTDITGDSGHKPEVTSSQKHIDMQMGEEDGNDNHLQEGNHEADKHKRHSEFKAEYHFVCNNPNKLEHISIMLFRNFPGIKQIKVQLLTGTKQTALELTAKKPIIDF